MSALLKSTTDIVVLTVNQPYKSKYKAPVLTSLLIKSKQLFLTILDNSCISDRYEGKQNKNSSVKK